MTHTLYLTLGLIAQSLPVLAMGWAGYMNVTDRRKQRLDVIMKEDISSDELIDMLGFNDNNTDYFGKEQRNA